MLFDYTGNTVDETVQGQQLNQYINIYLDREGRKNSFIVTAENLIWPVVFLFFCSWWPAEK